MPQESLGRLNVWVGANVRPLLTGLARGKQALRGFGKAARGITSVLGPLGLAAGAAGGAFAAFSSIKFAVQAGAEFEQQMATVEGVMRASGEEMSRMTDLAREMGETTRFKATEAADALKFLGMTGFNAAEAMEALPGVLDLAAASETELGRSADIASNILKTFQLETQELGRVNDVLVGTMTRSNVNMEQLAESMKFAGPVANAFGFSIEETAGLIGKLGDAGVQGSMAGTQLAFAMHKANKVAADMGLESADLIDVLDDLNKQGADAADIMQLFGLRGGRAALILRDMIPEIRSFQQELHTVGGEAKDLAEKKMATLQGAWLEFKSAVESVAIDAFNQFGEGLNSVLRGITGFVRENKAAIASIGSGFANAMEFVDTLIATVRSNMTLVIGELKKLWLDAQAIGSEIAGNQELADSLRLQGLAEVSLAQTKSNKIMEDFWDRNIPKVEEFNEKLKESAEVPTVFSKPTQKGTLTGGGAMEGFLSDKELDEASKRQAKFTKKWLEQQESAAKEVLKLIEDMNKKIAADANKLADIFTSSFFMTLKGEWEDLGRFAVRILEDIAFAIIQTNIAKAITNEVNKGSGAGGFFSWLGNLIPGFQEGGVVMQPTLARVGEVPEAIIPLDELRRSNFGGDIHVHQTINTPDLRGFNESASQLASRLSAQMAMAQRNT